MFDEYTKHDITHVDRMLYRLDFLIPDSTKKEMSVGDWLMTTLACYLHDFGLIVTSAEFDARNDTAFPEFKDEISGSDPYRAVLASKWYESRTQDQRERYFYQEFVRANHASRVRSWLTEAPNPTLGYDRAVTDLLRRLTTNLEPTFVRDLGVVCESHHLDDIYDLSKYPVDRPYGDSADEAVNVQYSAILLRATDLLHITSDRAPSVAFSLINPSNPTSQLEWAKHRSVRNVRPRVATNEEGHADPSLPRDEIEVHATFDTPEGFFGLTSYLQYAAKELSQCESWASATQKKCGVPHQFPWRNIDSSNVDATGFVTKPFKFQLDHQKILSLLTGHTLYNDTNVVLRELVQNSIDAVRLRKHVGSDGAEYSPRVKVVWDPDDRVIEIEDNGTGMSQEVIEENFLRVGSSRYQSARFTKEHPNFNSISRFGIGVLSTFMIANEVDVTTYVDGEPEARHLKLQSVHGQYLMKLLARGSAEVPEGIRKGGTKVSVHVKPSSQIKSVLDVLRYWIVLPRCDVFFREAGQDIEIKIGFETLAEALEEGLVASNAVTRKDGKLQSAAAGEQIAIRTFDREGFSLAYAVTWNSWYSQWEFYRSERAVLRDYIEIAETGSGTCIEGIRVLDGSPGFQASGHLAAISDNRGANAPKTNVARSAIEQTPEYNKHLKEVYEAYISHIASEVYEMQEDRRCSTTKAAREAHFILGGLISAREGGGNPQSRRLFDEAVKSLPAFAIEVDASRSARSLDDLDEFDVLLTTESSLSKHIEYVLGAMPITASFASIMSAVGEPLPYGADLPLLCGLQPSGHLSSVFLATWGIARIELDENERLVKATWRKFEDGAPTLISANERPRWLPRSLIRENSIHRDRLGRATFSYVVASGNLDLDGLDGYGAVRVGARQIVLPGASLSLIRPTDETVDPRILAWCCSSIYHFASTEVRPSDANGIQRFLHAIEPMELSRYVDLDSVAAAVANMNFAAFDSSNWERNFEK